MHERILIAGSGGQGIILTGKLLAHAALHRVPHLTFIPAYGAEVRGGTSNCQLVFSDAEISSPVSEAFDSMLIMNQESLDRFSPELVADGLLIANATLCQNRAVGNPRTLFLPITELAQKAGAVKAANFVMLGAFLGARNLPWSREIHTAASELLAGRNPGMLELNLRALKAGMEATACS